MILGRCFTVAWSFINSEHTENELSQAQREVVKKVRVKLLESVTELKLNTRDTTMGKIACIISGKNINLWWKWFRSSPLMI